MQYLQMTLDDWLDAKESLRKELQNVKQSFNRIGFYLRKIDDSKAYEQEGYTSLASFAKEEYGLEASTVSRFIAINKEFSLEGYSEQMDPKYLEFKRSQLEEMLKLPPADREMITEETPRQVIRDLKTFNKTMPVPGEADSLSEIMKKFYAENPDVLKEVLLSIEEGKETRQLAEIVNPSGNRTYKKGIFFLIMSDSKISLKQFGTNPKSITWGEFFEKTKEIYPEEPGGGWQQHLKKEEVIEAPKSEKKPEQTNEPANSEKEVVKEPEKVQKKEVQIKRQTPVAPAQVSAERLEKKDQTAVSSRKNFIDKLTTWEAACYIIADFKRGILSQIINEGEESLDDYLQEIVDKDGRGIEE